ncbi:MAG: class I SAM-dependent methyltransferase [Gammaproteobacteria bacterium]|nr:MAG: class I SAM-dependent methyltransferase [Gammaproteobacteria bacterium]
MATNKPHADDDGPDDNTRQLKKAYAARSPEEIRQLYDRWAADYEDHMRNVGYAHPAMVAAMLSRHLPPADDPILDAGAGTGIMAGLLVAMGYSHIVGVDASAKMLALAADKNLYRELRQMVLGRPLDFADQHFAAVVGAGVFTEGHAPLAALDELVRATRSGGYVVFSVARAYLETSFEEKRKSLEAAGRWRFVDASRRYNSTPLEGDIPARVFAFQVI